MIGRAELIALPTFIIVVLYLQFLLLLHDFLPSHKTGDLLFNLLEISLLNNATNYKTFIFKKLVKIVSYMTKLYFKISVSILKLIEAFKLTDCIFLFTI